MFFLLNLLGVAVNIYIVVYFFMKADAALWNVRYSVEDVRFKDSFMDDLTFKINMPGVYKDIVKSSYSGPAYMQHESNITESYSDAVMHSICVKNQVNYWKPCNRINIAIQFSDNFQ